MKQLLDNYKIEMMPKFTIHFLDAKGLELCYSIHHFLNFDKAEEWAIETSQTHYAHKNNIEKIVIKKQDAK